MVVNAVKRRKMKLKERNYLEMGRARLTGWHNKNGKCIVCTKPIGKKTAQTFWLYLDEESDIVASAPGVVRPIHDRCLVFYPEVKPWLWQGMSPNEMWPVGRVSKAAADKL